MNIQPFGSEMSRESLEPLLAKQVMVVIGGGKGDEGKGGDAYALATHGDYDLLISSVGGPNAGHTVVSDDGRTFVGHNLPGSVVSGKPAFLGQGKYINISGLAHEIQDLENIGIHSPLYIAEGANIIFPSFHAKIDANIENCRENKVGTTKSGMGPCVATRSLRTGVTIGKLLGVQEENTKKEITELLATNWDTSAFDRETIQNEVSHEKQVLQGLVDSGKIIIVSNDFAQNLYLKGKKILVEGAQSPELGMFGGAYPLNTSTDTSFLGNLSPLGITPTIEKVGQLVVAKLFPSAVGEHIFQERVSGLFPELVEQEAIFGKETGEFGATTKRARMIGLPSPALLANIVKANVGYITGISLRKLDVIPQFKEIVGFEKLPIVTSYDEKGTPQIEYIGYDVREVIDTYKNIILAEAKGQDITFIGGFGPEPMHSRVV